MGNFELAHELGGNIEYSTERLVAANTVAQVKEFVAKHGKFKVLGTRHCVNRRGTTF